MYTIIKIIACTEGGLKLANVAKYTRASCGHMFAHYERAKDVNGDYIKFKNQDIDTEKTGQNYNLAPDRGMSQMDYAKQRCSEVQCLKRKDLNVMCSWVVTAPKTLPKQDEREFFEQTYKFLENRYGTKNVISAHVHMDEISPHMHFSFVPVTYDKVKGVEKVNAKEKVSRADLQTFHKDLEKTLELHFGREIGILNEATKEGDKSIAELKRGSAREELQAIKQTIKDLQEKIDGLQQAREVYRGDLQGLQKALKVAEGVVASYHQIDAIEGKIGAFSKDKVTIATNDFETLKEGAKKTTALEYKLTGLEGELQRSKNREDKMEKFAQRLKEDNADLKVEVQKYKGAYKTLSDKHCIAKDLLAQHGVDEKRADYFINETHKQLQEKQLAKEKAIKPKSRNLGMER